MRRTATYSTPTGWFVMKFAFTSIHGPQRMKPTGTCSVFFCKITVKLTVFDWNNDWMKCQRIWYIQYIHGAQRMIPTVFGNFDLAPNLHSFSEMAQIPKLCLDYGTFWIDIHGPLRMNFHTFQTIGWTVNGLVQTVIVTRGWRLLTLAISIVMPKHHYMVDILDF